jgi:hypothetical protein
MSRTKYVIVCSDGTSYDLPDESPVMEYGKPKEPRFDLPALLADGWNPVRETGMGGGDRAAFALVVLGK